MCITKYGTKVVCHTHELHCWFGGLTEDQPLIFMVYYHAQPLTNHKASKKNGNNHEAWESDAI